MYLTKPERKAIMSAYGHEKAVEKDHYEVDPDTWVYLFDDNGKKYILIATDYLGYYDFEVFPHLLRFDTRHEFVLQQEIPAKNNIPETIHINTILFEYTD